MVVAGQVYCALRFVHGVSASAVVHNVSHAGKYELLVVGVPVVIHVVAQANHIAYKKSIADHVPHNTH